MNAQTIADQIVSQFQIVNIGDGVQGSGCVRIRNGNGVESIVSAVHPRDVWIWGQRIFIITCEGVMIVDCRDNISAWINGVPIAWSVDGIVDFIRNIDFPSKPPQSNEGTSGQ